MTHSERLVLGGSIISAMTATLALCLAARLAEADEGTNRLPAASDFGGTGLSEKTLRYDSVAPDLQDAAKTGPERLNRLNCCEIATLSSSSGHPSRLA